MSDFIFISVAPEIEEGEIILMTMRVSFNQRPKPNELANAIKAKRKSESIEYSVTKASVDVLY